VNQEEDEQNEVDGLKKGAGSTGKVMQVILTCIEQPILAYLLTSTALSC